MPNDKIKSSINALGPSHEQSEAISEPDKIVLRAALDAAPDALFVIDYETELILDANETAISQFGYTLDELRQNTLHELCATGRSDVEPPTLDSELVKQFCCTFKTKSGSTLPTEVSMRSKTLAGKSCVIASVRDITQSVQNRVRLDQIQAALNAVDEAVLVSDPETKYIVTANQAAQRLYGATEEELQARRACEIDQSASPGEIASRLKWLLSNPSEIITLFRTVKHASGNEIPVEIVLSTIHQNEKPYIVAVIRDISVRQVQNDLLHSAMAEAKAANEAKNDFLSRISHELRTPLNAILGFSQVLHLDAQSDEQKNHLEHVLRGGNRLLKLIEEVLDLSRIETRSIVLDACPIVVSDAVTTAVALIGHSASERDVEFTITGDPSLIIDADPDRLSQVLLNLLSNAVKYNIDGGRVSVESSRRSDGFIEIVVSDTGIGIGPQELKRIGTPFDRLGAENSDVLGTGLGLSITKSLIAAMGGKFSIESIFGEGTSVKIELPSSVGTAEGTNAETEPLDSNRLDSQTVNILAIEDDKTHQALLQVVIDRVPNWRIEFSRSKAEAESVLKQYQPDLILLDVSLPDVSGTEMLDYLKSRHSTTDTPVLVVSADAQKVTIDKFTKAGADHYITKPIVITELSTTIQQSLDAASG